jgi:hypothetical protein
MVLMEVNSLPVGIINKTNIIKTGNSKSHMVIVMTVNMKNSQRTGDQATG